MPTLKTEILMIRHPSPEKVAVGAAFAPTLASARERMQNHSYAVVVFPSDLTGDEDRGEFLDFLDQTHQSALRVIIHSPSSPALLADLINRGRVFAILPDFDHPEFEMDVQRAVEEVRLSQQNDELLALVQDQNERLKRLTIELEERVERRQSFLSNAREKAIVTSNRLSTLHRAIVAVHGAQSIAEMERLLHEALTPTLHLSWVRIHFGQRSSEHPHRLDSLHCIFQVEMSFEKDLEGQLWFARGLDQPFTKDEKSFLLQLADAFALAVDRTWKMERLESLKGEWQSTFDSISHPLSLVDADYQIFRTNRAYAEQSGVAAEKLVGRKCYEMLFQRDQPCPNCRLGDHFTLEPDKEKGEPIYKVSGHPIRMTDRSLFVVMYRDVTDQQRLERQIVESAKLAELGTIGSSIAHEINNPLGGMLSFLQLIKMDLKPDDPIYADIAAMESGAKRCRDIVQNLLGFTRKSGPDQFEEVDFRDVIERALKITDLQTRSKGIKVEVALPSEACMIRGQTNQLSQAICNILQNGIDIIKKQKGSPGQLDVQLSSTESHFSLLIASNGHFELSAQTATPGLGLTVARHIINDHHGVFEEVQTKEGQTHVRVSIPRPVFAARSGF